MYKDSGTTVRVQVVQLDHAWVSLDKPKVSVLKIDVEGGEVGVLQGAAELIQAQRPAILLEANFPKQLERFSSVLDVFGYYATQPPGFMPWNYLYLQTSAVR